MIRRICSSMVVWSQTVLCGNALAGPADCQRLKTSDVPYQTSNVTASTMGPTSQTKPSTLQYYRKADGYTVVFTEDEAQAFTKARFRFGILLASHNVANGKHLRIKSTIDSGPTDVYAGARNFTYRETSAIDDGVAKTYDVVGTYAGGEDLKVGACVFHVLRYDVTKTLIQDGKPTTTTVDAALKYSPELRTIVSSKIVSPPLNLTVEATTRAITTDFAPIADPGD